MGGGRETRSFIDGQEQLQYLAPRKTWDLGSSTQEAFGALDALYFPLLVMDTNYIMLWEAMLMVKFQIPASANLDNSHLHQSQSSIWPAVNELNIRIEYLKSPP